MKFILEKMKNYAGKVTESLIFKVIGTLADLALPLLTAYLIDKLLPVVTDSETHRIIILGLIMLVVALIGWTFNVRANRLAEYVAAYSVRDTRNELFKKINELSASQIDDITSSSLISRMTTDTYNIYTAIGTIQRLGVRAPLLFVGGIAASFFLDWVLALIMVALVPFIMYFTLVNSKKGRPLYAKIQYRVDQLIRTLRENITGARVVKALSMVDHENQRFHKDNSLVIQEELKATISMSKIRPIVDFIMNIGLVIVLVVGAYRVYDNQTEVGEILAFVTYFTIILNATMSLTRVFIRLSRASASAERIEEVLNLEVEEDTGKNPVEEDISQPHIAFNNVSFSYNQTANHLENIDFKLYKGQTLGILGATGAGKTTIINLLMRFYEPKTGNIEVYGKDAKTINKKKLRESIGVVLQNDLVLSETIYENIQFNRNHIDLETVEFAKTIAQATFIDEMPLKHYEKMAQRGSNISGGQKQRLLIARAVAGKPDLLILDDASSALDYQTDMLMRQALNQELKETTKIIVAQRISSIKDANLILLIDNGQIIASGTHESLTESSSDYQAIIKHQLGGEVL